MKASRELSLHTNHYSAGLVVNVLRKKLRTYRPTKSSLARIMRMIQDNPEEVLIDADLDGNLAVYFYL